MSDEERESENEEELDASEAEPESAAEVEAPNYRHKYYNHYDDDEDDEEEYEYEAEYMYSRDERPKSKVPQKEEEAKALSEAEKALMAQKKKHEADDVEKLREYEEQRRIQREKEEEELRLLKEKQERRRQEREEEEKHMSERKKEEEERRKQEEEQRKVKAEEEKRKKEEDKKKKAAMMGAPLASGPNFEVKKDSAQEKFDKFGNIVKAKAEMGQTKEQHEEAKKRVLAEICKASDFSGLDIGALKSKVKELHQRISKLEALRYDLEKRQERQDYDLKELNERQRQISRNKALKKGLDPEEAANTRYPPKVPVSSKYDRQIDRRSYVDRRYLYESPKDKKSPSIFHGSSRPPEHWGRRKDNEELENVRKNLEPPKYVETVKVEGAKPPMDMIPAQLPAEEEEPDD